MSYPSPLLGMQRDAGALLAPFGEPGVEVVQVFDHLELEYAAIVKRAALLDQPQRALVDVAGPDRLEFLDRMLTQEMKRFEVGSVRRSFWLSRKGRIEADLRVSNLPDRVRLDADVVATARLLDTLPKYVVMEDVSFEPRPDLHRLSIHGPRAWEVLLAAAGVGPIPPLPGTDTSIVLAIAGSEVRVERDDSCGVPGLELTLARDAVVGVHTALVSRPECRPIGWHAFNVARIEAGRAVEHVDFGPDSLPHESGVLGDRVSFTKGCYLGQEIVARMHSRGHPRRVLVSIVLEATAPSAAEGSLDLPQAEAGAAVYPVEGSVSAARGPMPAAIGAVTSSAIAPRAGSASVCLAQVKFEFARPGSRVRVETDRGLVAGVVSLDLRLIPPERPEAPAVSGPLR